MNYHSMGIYNVLEAHITARLLHTEPRFHHAWQSNNSLSRLHSCFRWQHGTTTETRHKSAQTWTYSVICVDFSAHHCPVLITGHYRVPYTQYQRSHTEFFTNQSVTFKLKNNGPLRGLQLITVLIWHVIPSRQLYNARKYMICRFFFN